MALQRPQSGPPSPTWQWPFGTDSKDTCRNKQSSVYFVVVFCFSVRNYSCQSPWVFLCLLLWQKAWSIPWWCVLCQVDGKFWCGMWQCHSTQGCPRNPMNWCCLNPWGTPLLKGQGCPLRLKRWLWYMYLLGCSARKGPQRVLSWYQLGYWSKEKRRRYFIINWVLILSQNKYL